MIFVSADILCLLSCLYLKKISLKDIKDHITQILHESNGKSLIENRRKVTNLYKSIKWYLLSPLQFRGLKLPTTVGARRSCGLTALLSPLTENEYSKKYVLLPPGEQLRLARVGRSWKYKTQINDFKLLLLSPIGAVISNLIGKNFFWIFF